MAEGTKERILRIALELFAQNGYLGTSMNDIAGQLGFTKAALYKHYASKQEILDKIVERMNKMDYERAEVYEMPETEPDGFAEAYLHTPIQKIRTYSLAQFDHWTKEPFSSNFRKMLTLEQYRDPKLAQLHHDYLAGGPLEYMAAIFRMSEGRYFYADVINEGVMLYDTGEYALATPRALNFAEIKEMAAEYYEEKLLDATRHFQHFELDYSHPDYKFCAFDLHQVCG